MGQIYSFVYLWVGHPKAFGVSMVPSHNEPRRLDYRPWISALLGSGISLVGLIIPCCTPILHFWNGWVFILCHFMLDICNLCLLISFRWSQVQTLWL